MCDGWSGPRRRHLVNFLVYSNRGTVFHKSINATNVLSRTADYYFGLMDKVVEEIGEQYIVQIITDNEAAMKAASKKLMEKRPHLYWTACTAHCIDLILEDIVEWWIHYGISAPQLQKVAVKVLSQTTSSSNCERNWSTFSLIHTKTRNRLKYQKLNKIVYVYYNMRLKIRHATRRSDEERDDHFNPINLDYIFDEDDPLAKWLQKEEHAILDDVDNSEWVDADDTQNPQNVNLSENISRGGRGLSPSASGSEDDDGPNGGETQDNTVNRTTYHEEDGGIRDSTQQRRHSVSFGDGGSNRIRRSRPINDIYTDHNLIDQFGQLEVGQDHERAHHWQQRPLYPYYPPQVQQFYFNQPEPPFMGIGYPHRSHQHSYSGSSSYGSNHTVREPSTHRYSQQQFDSSDTTNNFEHCNFTNNFYGYLFEAAGQNSHGDDQFNEDYVDPPVPPRHSFWH
ncbi:hypothetical protein RHMOL_Rhmol05G0234700 [Rhododendron molle]|uniref:Uncharacterized protein n=1 Tax=Rhododendron molle TaxID=49168 RepID=A0ACC0NSI3_RHOML|nr:hypothetical protein RHMOL_Rhmol05G0234700 [Rhododendron molle]